MALPSLLFSSLPGDAEPHGLLSAHPPRSNSGSMPRSYWGQGHRPADPSPSHYGAYTNHGVYSRPASATPSSSSNHSNSYIHSPLPPLSTLVADVFPPTQQPPSIDLSGLIPMYDAPPTSSRSHDLADLAYGSNAQNESWGGAGYERVTSSSLWHDAHLSPHQWNGPALHSAHGGAYSPYSPPSPYSSSTSSASSSSPSGYFLPPTLPDPTSAPLVTPRRRSSAGGGADEKKVCSHCAATATPLWRRDPSTQRTLCNACGLYLQQRGKLRPQALIDADRDDPDDEIMRIPDAEYTGPKCSHCGTRQTSVWRRDKKGSQVCNACGVYARLRGKERPLSLKRNKIKPRTKHTR